MPSEGHVTKQKFQFLLLDLKALMEVLTTAIEARHKYLMKDQEIIKSYDY